MRITGWVIRFIQNIKKKRKNEKIKNKKFLTAEEINCALEVWIKDNQLVLYNSKKLDVVKKNLILEKVDGIYRSMGRLMNSKLAYDTKCPIMLSTDHKLSELVVLMCINELCTMELKTRLQSFEWNFGLVRQETLLKSCYPSVLFVIDIILDLI